MPRDLKVFISSTSEDLKDYRSVAQQVVVNMGWKPVMMEHFGALTASTVQACAEQLSTCDLVVLLVAFRRGSVPPPEHGGNGRDSYTALELAKAREKEIPVVALFADEQTWPGKLYEKDEEARQWVESFRAGLHQPAAFFQREEPTTRESERLPAFRNLLRQALLDHRDRIPAPPAGGAAQPDYTETAVDAFVKGNCLPLLGSGVFGPGPLSAPALSAVLYKGQPSNQPPPCLATAAEYYEVLHGSRDDLLEELTSVLQSMSAEVEPTKVHELLALTKLPEPHLIVSTTPDLVLERTLDAAGIRYAIVTHVLRSCEGKHDGKVLVLRKGKAPELHPADKLEPGGDEVVIYKPLGSPLLHAQLDPEDEIDTVVITETDHLLFLSRLQSPETQVPSRFHRAFQRERLVFMGYPLDVWHQRLVVQMFKVTGTSQQPSKKRQQRLAVREPADQMEGLAWRELDVKLVAADPNAFARDTIAAIEAKKVSHAA